MVPPVVDQIPPAQHLMPLHPHMPLLCHLLVHRTRCSRCVPHLIFWSHHSKAIFILLWPSPDRQVHILTSTPYHRVAPGSCPPKSRSHLRPPPWSPMAQFLLYTNILSAAGPHQTTLAATIHPCPSIRHLLAFETRMGCISSTD